MSLELILIIQKDGLWYIFFFGIYLILNFIGSWLYKPIRNYSIWFHLALIVIVLCIVIWGSRAIGIERENPLHAIVFAVLLSLINTFFPVKQIKRK